ncbi:LytR/AlgR family response regulator transcription factor [Streptococcus parasuis]|uniref:LytR/AlgR family response regulator transcription factor n=1 Tax=Streptococcus parasuis TaxID=1501662 RepID=UPI0024124D0D|nr:LytTR family DNA-binding domain-containing protein [Streptococcus parasuis]MDG4477206.1 LytTR family DNA-binding domain-containing protein [Streptococcus parasuis]
MLRIAIVEDDAKYSQLLIKYLKEFENEKKQCFKIQQYRDGIDIVDQYDGNVDIILMDIEMTYMDGMTAAEKIRLLDKEVVIIFITNMMHYAMKGYAVEAFDYILKPINYYAFSQRLNRAIERMKKKSGKQLLISRNGVVKKISTEEIIYVEAHNHDLEYHLINETFSVRGTLRSLEEELGGLSFFRCNSGCLINFDFVDGLDNNNLIINGTLISVSRARRKEFLNRMNHYMNEVGE